MKLKDLETGTERPVSNCWLVTEAEVFSIKKVAEFAVSFDSSGCGNEHAESSSGKPKKISKPLDRDIESLQSDIPSAFTSLSGGQGQNISFATRHCHFDELLQTQTKSC